MEGLLIRFLLFLAALFPAMAEGLPAYVYVEAPRFAPPSLEVVRNGQKQRLLRDFAASADPCVSFDGRRVLFAGKRKPGDRWQVWEVDLDGGAPRQITAFAEDAVKPFYLPGDHIVYSRRTASGLQIETAPLDGGATVRLTYSPGDHVVNDVLRDGRVLFDAPHPESAPQGREIYAVYTDGSGVETHRCDHGMDRHSGRELSSGDIVFESGGRLGRFTSARAKAMDLPRMPGEFRGPVAEISAEEWLVAYRPRGEQFFGLYRWRPRTGAPEKLWAAAGADAIQPVLAHVRDVPKRHPSALGNRDGANLLCLNVYTSRSPIAADSVAAVRVWTLDGAGEAVALGDAPVEQDGSFFVQTPSERAVRFELLDRVGKTIAAEKGWFWARRGEQRVCVGCHAGPERAPENAVPQTLLRSTVPVRMGPVTRVPGTDGSK